MIAFYCDKCGDENTYNYTSPLDSTNDLITIDCSNCQNSHNIHIWSSNHSSNYDYNIQNAYKKSDYEAEYKSYINSVIFNQEQLLNTAISEVTNKSAFINRLLFTQSIVNLETYFSDTIKHCILNSDLLLKSFIINSDKLKNEKYTLQNYIMNPNFIYDKVKGRLNEILYHNLAAVIDIYENVFQIKLSKILTNKRSYLEKSISIRHDCVHRNGKTIDGFSHEITQDDIIKLTMFVSELMIEIEKQIQPVRIKFINENNPCADFPEEIPF
ncbi:hypothetical protein LOS73_14480 [Pseudoalteromonas sp. SCSIO 43210]